MQIANHSLYQVSFIHSTAHYLYQRLTSTKNRLSKDFVLEPFPLILGQLPGAVISQIRPV